VQAIHANGAAGPWSAVRTFTVNTLARPMP